MITGIYALLLDLLCVLALPSVFILVLIRVLNPKHRREPPINILRIIPLGIMLVIFVPIIAIHFFYWVRGNIIIATLDPKSVGSITINNCTFNQAEDITPIVTALNRSTMLMPNHERTGPEVSMTVSLLSGEIKHYRISKLTNGAGAVLRFIRPREDGYWSDGDALVPTLADVLNALSCELPIE